jgi:cell division protein FtsB
MLLRFVAVLAVPVTIYALYATGVKALDNYQLQLEAEQLRQRVTALRTENVTLQNQIVAARSDESIEAIARVELGLINPGDNAVVLVDPPGATVRIQPPASPPPPPEPPLRRWWAYFFGS